MKKSLRLFILPALFSLALTALAAPSAMADYRIATVDVNKVLNRSEDSLKKKKELDEYSAKAKKKIEAKRAELKPVDEKIRAGQIPENSEQAEKHRQALKDFSRLVKDTEDDLRKKFMKLNREITDQVLGVIKKYAEKNDIDLVLDRSETPRGPVLFNLPETDITDSVIEEMNG